MAQKAPTRTVSGAHVYVWANYGAVSSSSAKLIEDHLKKFQFGGIVRVAEVGEDTVWRTEVRFAVAKATVTVQVIYQTTSNPVSDELAQACEDDAKANILKPVAEFVRAFAAPESPAPPAPQPQPAPAAPPAPQPPQGGGQQGGQGGGGRQQGGQGGGGRQQGGGGQP